MRLYELLLEGYNEEMKSDIMSDLLSIKASKGTTVPTALLVRTLNAKGYSCTVDSIASLLSDLPIVKSVDSQQITLGDENELPDDGGMSKDEADDAVMNRLVQQGIKK